MTYYRLTREKGRNWTLHTIKGFMFDEKELLSICNEAYQENPEEFIHGLHKRGIEAVMTFAPPSYEYFIHQKADGTFEVTKNIRYSIVAFAGNGTLRKITDKAYEDRDEAEEALKKYKSIYGEHLFISQK